MENTNPLCFLDYDKISDNLIYLGKDIVLRFNVGLAQKAQDGSRIHFHHEFEYSSKYTNKGKVCSIRRNFDYYLSIDIKGDFENGVMIKPSNMIMLRLKLNQVAQWFTKLFKMKEDKLVIIGKYEPISIALNEYKCLEFEPTVIYYEDGTFKEGVRMFINSHDIYCDLSIDKFMELYYLIDSMDMYQCATSMLNYIGAPEFGTNMYSFDGNNSGKGNNYRSEDSYDDYNQNKYSKGSKGNPENSFFNKMNKK